MAVGKCNNLHLVWNKVLGTKIDILLAVIVACLASFRALFTARSSSNRSPAKSSGISDLESLPLRRLDKQPAGFQASDNFGPELVNEQNPAGTGLQGKSEALVHTKAATTTRSETPLAELSRALSRRSSNDDSIHVRDDQNVRNEYSVFPSSGLR